MSQLTPEFMSITGHITFSGHRRIPHHAYYIEYLRGHLNHYLVSASFVHLLHSH